jgi:hypothetical protein|tara:strand:+ start:8984 stop:9784 length:801 start_codon:yes stop_codon:yes gene_type:complete
VKKFIIYGLGRSGTTNLAAGLASGILYEKVIQEPFLRKSGDALHFEYLKKLQEEYGFFPKNLLGGKDGVFPRGRERVHSFLDRLYEEYHGIKHVFSSCNSIINIPLIEYLDKNEIKVIHLRRKNILAATLSNAVSLQHKSWGWKEDTRERLDNFDYTDLDCDRLLASAEYIYNSVAISECAIKKTIKENNLLSFYYEDLYTPDAGGRNENFNKICDFIEVKRDELFERVIQYHFLDDRKQNKPSNLSRIGNYDDCLKLGELYPHLK